MSDDRKVALITGITGQDGSYLTELLLEKGYTVSLTIHHFIVCKYQSSVFVPSCGLSNNKFFIVRFTELSAVHPLSTLAVLTTFTKIDMTLELSFSFTTEIFVMLPTLSPSLQMSVPPKFITLVQ